jgi:hypothetical protein
MDEFEYDAFLSYRHQEPGQSWVRKTLWPALEQRGVRVCIDERDFRLGVALLKEMERAVLTSRYTVAILTPSYLQGNFAELEALMARQLGLEEKQRRLLPILREPCKLDPLLQVLLRLDMTDDAQFEAQVDRLAQALLQPSDL